MGFGRRALEKILSVIHDQHAVSNLHDQIHIVLDNYNGHSAGAQLSDPVEKFLDFGCIQAGGGLIHHEQTRRGRKRAGELKHPLLAIGKRARPGLRPFFETNKGEKLPRLVSAAREVTPKRGPLENILPGWDVVMDVKARNDIIEHWEVLKKADLLERTRQAEPDPSVCL